MSKIVEDVPKDWKRNC